MKYIINIRKKKIVLMAILLAILFSACETSIKGRAKPTSDNPKIDRYLIDPKISNFKVMVVSNDDISTMFNKTYYLTFKNKTRPNTRRSTERM